jgi:hypothetical protein
MVVPRLDSPAGWAAMRLSLGSMIAFAMKSGSTDDHATGYVKNVVDFFRLEKH